MIRFGEYLLLESIKYRSTTFGTNVDTNDNKYGFKDGDRDILTDNSKYYFVSLSLFADGEVIFGVNDKYSTDIDDYSISQTNAENVFNVFGKVLYIVIGMSNAFKCKRVSFVGAYEKLDNFYKTLTSNKLFIKYMLSVGFKYIGEVNGYYTFELLK
jgi:hypothetical protein